MPRGIKGSGKPRNNTAEPAKRRQGKKPQDAVLVPAAAPVSQDDRDTATGAQAPEQQAEQNAAGTRAPAPAGPTPDRAPAVHDRALAEAEAALVAKYPGQRFKPGSLLPSGSTAEFGNKRSVIILCRECGAERRIATSDAFHTDRCLPCGKKAKREARKTTKGERQTANSTQRGTT